MVKPPRRSRTAAAGAHGLSDSATLAALATRHAAAGEFIDAERRWRQVLKLDPAHRAALHQLAQLLLHRGEPGQAAKYLSQLVAAIPDAPDFRLELARAWLGTGKLPAARAACHEALEHHADPYDCHCLMAEIAERMEDRPAAIAAYRAALALRPEVAALHNNLGLLHRSAGDQLLALAAFDAALAVSPASASAWNNRGNTLRDLACYEDAIESYRHALRAQPDLLDPRFNLGLVYQQLGLSALALAEFSQVLAVAPRHEAARLQQIEAWMSAGRFADAAAAIDSLLADAPTCAQAHYLRTQMQRHAADESGLVARIGKLRARAGLAEDERIYLDFALGKLHDDLGEHERAFTAYARGNRRKHATLDRTAPARARRLVEALLGLPADAWAGGSLPPATGAPAFIFVVGMPRSGTTLIEQILAAHPAIAGAGEIDFFGPSLALDALRRGLAEPTAATGADLDPNALQSLRAAYLRRVELLAPGSSWVSDKTPVNFAYLGLIQRLLPGARVVHCRRDPLDTCLSIYFQLFGSLPYAFDLDDIAAYYLAYRRLMQRWQKTLSLPMLDLDYEAVVLDRAIATRALLEFCGLPWDARCLAPERSERSVTTASRWQARQPVYRHALQRWQHYAAHLGRLREMLAEINASQPL